MSVSIVNGHILIPVSQVQRKIAGICRWTRPNQFIRELDGSASQWDSILKEGCGTDNERFFVDLQCSIRGMTAEFYHDWGLTCMKKNKTIDLELLDSNISRPDSHEDFGQI